MAYRIEVKPGAEKALARIEKRFQRRIVRAVDALARDPRPPGCAKLAGANDAYRIRVGDYRIVYQIENRVLIVCITRIAHRREVYDAHLIASRL